MSAFDDVLTALHARLAGNAGVAALVGPRIYSDVPQDAGFPYVVIDGPSSEDAGTDSSPGLLSEVRVHAHSRGAGLKEAKDILTAIYDALHEKPLSLAHNHCVDCRFITATAFDEPDGAGFHTVADYEIRTQAL